MAAREPQDVYRRNLLVARVVGPEIAGVKKRPFAEALAELQRICAEENYELPTTARRDRPNPFAPTNKQPQRRKKRRHAR